MEKVENDKAEFDSIDQYIASFPPRTQTLLETIRSTIRVAAPEAREIISYGMPAFALNGNLVYFSALKNHIGLYPTSSGIAAFESELAKYEHSKGSVKFPLDQPLPLELITRIVQFRVTEDREKAAKKTARKKA